MFTTKFYETGVRNKRSFAQRVLIVCRIKCFLIWLYCFFLCVCKLSRTFQTSLRLAFILGYVNLENVFLEGGKNLFPLFQQCIENWTRPLLILALFWNHLISFSLPQKRRTIWRRWSCCWWTQCRTHWKRPWASRETFSALHSKMGQRLPSPEARLGYWRSLREIWIHFQHKSKTFAFSVVSMSVYWGASSKQAAKRIT